MTPFIGVDMPFSFVQWSNIWYAVSINGYHVFQLQKNMSGNCECLIKNESFWNNVQTQMFIGL